jgi:hypothetical protein
MTQRGIEELGGRWSDNWLAEQGAPREGRKRGLQSEDGGSRPAGAPPRPQPYCDLPRRRRADGGRHSASSGRPGRPAQSCRSRPGPECRQSVRPPTRNRTERRWHPTGSAGGFSVYKFDAIPPVEVVTLSRQPTDPKVLLRILDAVRNRLEIDIEYASLTGSVQQSRAVAPHSLAHSAGRWYVRSWSREHSDFRDYNLNRIIMVGDHRAPHRPGRADFPHPVLHGRASLGTAYWRVIRAGGKGCRLSRSRRRSHRKVPCRPLRDSHFFQTRPT